jgi:GT2 family glycosyltransferase
MKIAVLLTCHNRKEKTIICLESLFKSDLPFNYSLKVFLVDDGSSDGTSNAILEKFPTVKIIQGNGNLFWNRGMHLAWKTASNKNDYDFYLWLNDDVKILSNGIKTLLDNHKLEPNSLLCGVMSSEFDKTITYGGSELQKGLLEPNISKPLLCQSINGNLVLIPKNIFKKVGNLDNIFSHAIGDFDYGLRVIKCGFDCRISTKVVGYCEQNKSIVEWCNPKVKFLDRLKSLYSPLGNSHPFYFFIYEKRHLGILTAFKHLITIHIRLIYPQLWKT